MGKELPNYMCKTLFNPKLTKHFHLRTHVRRGHISYTPKMKTVTSYLHWLEKKVLKIQDRDYSTEAESRKKEPRRIKIQHPEPPAHSKLLHTTLNEKTEGLPCHQTLAQILLGRHPVDQKVSK
jgi:hypothetical protein